MPTPHHYPQPFRTRYKIKPHFFHERQDTLIANPQPNLAIIRSRLVIKIKNLLEIYLYNSSCVAPKFLELTH